MQNRVSRTFVQSNFAEIVNQVYSDKKQIILTEEGVEIAAIVPIALMKMLQSIKPEPEIKEMNNSKKIQQIKQYRKGYKKFPENEDNIDSWQKAAFDSFSNGEW
ncbi:Prevent-host-death protein [Candidatus Magnetomorum sp. HK-1]|nr:Prevent-host-death protein [Candidatus Magnetomorum sp. HK-1]